MYHKVKVRSILLRSRLKDKLAPLSFYERKTCEECLTGSTFGFAGNHRHQERARDRGSCSVHPAAATPAGKKTRIHGNIYIHILPWLLMMEKNHRL